MRGIAARLSVSATALYQHFDSKASILREIRFHCAKKLFESLASAEDLSDPPDRLRHIAERYLVFARDNPWQYKVLMDSDISEWSELDTDETNRLIAPLHLVQKTIRDGVEKGSWRDGVEVNSASFRLWATMHGLAALMLSGRIAANHPVMPVGEHFVRDFVASIVQSVSKPGT